jgi:hypothetical protein
MREGSTPTARPGGTRHPVRPDSLLCRRCGHELEQIRATLGLAITEPLLATWAAVKSAFASASPGQRMNAGQDELALGLAAADESAVD